MRMDGRRAAVLVLTAGVVGALATAFLVWERADGQVGRLPEPLVAIDAEATIAPRVVLFGDTVFAHVDVVVDPSRIDPDSVRIAVDFAPFEVVDRPERRRQESRAGVFMRTTFTLRCLTGTCVPSQRSATYDLEPARIAFAAAGEERVDVAPLTAALPTVHVVSRFSALSSRSDGGTTPWQADLLSLPPVSYRVSPGSLTALLLLGAALLACAGVVLAVSAWPRRQPAPAPEPEPEPEPEPALSPLEQALALLERSIRVDGAAAQRRALELVAEELELSEWGDRQLAGTARALAWSEDVPPVAETSRLAARVRSALPHEVENAENGNGHVA